MFRYLMAALVALISVQVSDADDSPADFDLAIMPILTKFGCNSGACHGAATGRGEFRLSLFGSRPDEDLKAITQHLESRRVNRAWPDRSLFLLKPVGGVDHAGGVRFEPGSREAQTFQQWIAEGAIRNGQIRVVALQAEPSNIVAKIGVETTVRVLGTLSNGDVRDVTADISLTNSDPDSVSVVGDSVFVPRRPGRHLLIARYPGLVLPVEVLVPFSEAAETHKEPKSDSVSVSFVDQRIMERLNLMQLRPSVPVDDGIFLCRATLCLIGRRPNAEQIQSFLRNESTTKRSAMIEELMASPEFTDYWTWQLTRMLRVSEARSVQAASAWQEWIREQLVAEMPLNKVAAKMILATGDPDTNGPAAFHTVSRDARSQAEQFSETLLGIRLRCANCHDHPLDRWTQDDYHGLAAVFATVDRGPLIASKPDGTTIHPATGMPARPHIMMNAEFSLESDPRVPLGKWIEDPDNPMLARNLVNRVWKQLMGRGLVEPVDDLRVTNPPTHPELLDDLSTFFVANEFQLKPLIRAICLSEAWSRASSLHENSADTIFWSSRPPSRLSAEVLLDCLGDVTGIPEAIPGDPAAVPGDPAASVRMIQVAKFESSMASLEALKGCSDARLCAGSDNGSTDSLPLALHLVNGALLNRRLTAKSPLIRQLIEEYKDHSAVTEALYLRVLSRLPHPAEAAAWAAELEAAQAESRFESTIIDMAWALLTSDEFLNCP